MRCVVCFAILVLAPAACFAQRHGGGGGGGFFPGGRGGGFFRGGGSFENGRFRSGVISGSAFENGRFRSGLINGISGIQLPPGYFLTSQQTAVNLGIPPISPIPWLGVNTLGVNVLNASTLGWNPQLGLSNVVYPLNGYGAGGYPLLPVITDSGYEGGPNVIVLQPIQMPVQPPPPPVIVKSSIHEYQQPAESAQAGAQPSAFTLVMRDGSSQPAILVWVEGDVLHYIDPAGKTLRIPLATVDRDATERLNQEKNVSLHLPRQTT
jgi:hypothetical protein